MARGIIFNFMKTMPMVPVAGKRMKGVVLTAVITSTVFLVCSACFYSNLESTSSDTMHALMAAVAAAMLIGAVLIAIVMATR
jgi:hypothetical protein